MSFEGVEQRFKTRKYIFIIQSTLLQNDLSPTYVEVGMTNKERKDPYIEVGMANKESNKK